MSKGMIGCLGAGVIALVLGIIIFCMYISYSNAEVRLRNQIKAKQTDNTSQLDNAIKVISQNAQVTDAQKEALKEIIVGNAAARATKGGSWVTMVSEAVPNLDSSTATYRQLMNTITSARNQWTENQRALLDLKREHDNLIGTFPGSLFLSGRSPIDVVIVTSGRTKESFRTGEDNDTNVFDKRSKPAEK